MRILVIIASAGLLISCGVVGSPIAPEYVGVAVTVEKQKRQQARETGPEGTGSVVDDLSLEDHDIDLPPSHPVGTQ